MSLTLSVRRSTIVPYKPPLTEKNLPDQAGKVFIVTGGSGGLGKELVDILYQHNGRVYIAARSEAKTSAVITELQAKHPGSQGQLAFLPLQLEDLSTIRGTADAFLARESRLDVLWNNAGVMVPPQGSTTAQGHELQQGVNNLGHFLLTSLLLPTLRQTAAAASTSASTSTTTTAVGSVRVVWVSSSAADAAPQPALDFGNMDYRLREEGIWQKYARSKAACQLHASELARRTAGSGIITVALNPGNFLTSLQQNMPKMQVFMFKFVSSEPKNGAYTELFAGLSPTISEKDNGGWVSPFGKLDTPRKDLVEPELCARYWDWSEQQVKEYM
ncbi:hypothetical protein B0T25DRAFT_225420 [Lasiosphaeria hispida]|uniref:Short-chain dehydrogenase n=1 Tax=Lasiosphaeria hispida TaxID=260671 RepID=A0AAJ0HK72_9PEZI|nr:hypothetical protein B0T25DRAFT_225420 [Lasiosphaeria hispida]